MTDNLTYTRCGDCYIPDIKLTYTEPIEWNRFSRMARTCLQEHRPILYNDMILSEQLFPYLKEIGETAAKRMEQLEAEMLSANLQSRGIQPFEQPRFSNTANWWAQAGDES